MQPGLWRNTPWHRVTVVLQSFQKDTRLSMATIRQLRGRWQAMVRRRGVPPRCKSFDKRTDATRWARELEAEADRSGWVADTRLAEKTTLGELLTRYRDQVSPTKRSAHTERSRINAILRRPIVHRTLSKLTSADIATYRDERLKDVAPATVVRELNTLSHAIEIALREWGLWLPRNPVKMVRRPTLTREDGGFSFSRSSSSGNHTSIRAWTQYCRGERHQRAQRASNATK